MTPSDDSRPEGYTKPVAVWSVDYIDPRQPGEGSFQVGAFTTKAEAHKCLRRLKAEGFFADLRVNLIPVHRRIQDWEWDR